MRPKYLVRNPKLIIPIPDEIENTVITHDVTEFVIEKLLSIFINAIEVGQLFGFDSNPEPPLGDPDC